MTDLERVLGCQAEVELPGESNYDRSRRIQRHARRLIWWVALTAFIGIVSLIAGALEGTRERYAREAIQTLADRVLDTGECPRPTEGRLNSYAYFFQLAPEGKIIQRECAQITGPRTPKPAKVVPS